ncbi:MAG: hypothetical protein ABIH79_00460 [archaeon]
MDEFFRILKQNFSNNYLKKHSNVDLGRCSLGEFVGANRGKIEPRRNDSGNWEYLVTDRKLIFYYDYFRSKKVVESLKRSKRGETVLGVSDLSWLFNEFKKRYLENEVF